MTPPVDPEPDDSFRTMAKSSQPGLLRELGDFLIHNKRWWLVPMVVVLLILGGMIVVTNTAIIPTIYMLF
ncbi:MAG: DUF5989 family protein [Mariniblastus sp.]|nr:DUF5989 family protein [Mariniblastus sp.]